jgi:hypothetical protein
MKKKKECSKCHALKPIDEFGTNGFKVDGITHKIRGACLECDKLRHRKIRRGAPHLTRSTKCMKCAYVAKYMIRTVDEDGVFAFLCETCRNKVNESKI